MKITAEFNSAEEIQEFLGLFKGDTQAVKCVEFPPFKIEESKEAVNNLESKSKDIKVEKEEPKVDHPKENAEEKKVTKEEVRAAFTKLIKAGKQKEAKELTSKYGANKLPEVKEEDYPAILKDVEALL